MPILFFKVDMEDLLIFLDWSQSARARQGEMHSRFPLRDEWLRHIGLGRLDDDLGRIHLRQFVHGHLQWFSYYSAKLLP
jgi:hypothetical protein